MNSLLAKLERKATYPVGRVNGVVGVVYNEDDFDSSESDGDDDVDRPYEQEYVQGELRRYAAEPSGSNKGFADDVSSYCGFSEVDSIAPDHKTHPSDIYKTYNFKLNTDIKKELPIDSYRDQILSRIELNQVIVIEGPTGCGKTTQVPQIIMDSYREKNQYCNIVVTQPRKIATINVAKRVCEERGWTLGTVCGYQVGLEKKVSPDEIITYMTIGVLLQKLIRNKSLREYTHIIIDEVHERNQELDFLLLIVRKFLFTNSPQTKVILMSATINADEFAFYFRKQTSGQSIPAPIIKVNKVSQYNKIVFYLDQIVQIARSLPKFDIAKPEISEDIWKAFMFLIKIFDRLDTENPISSNKTGSVLVFLPGINEIEEAHNLLIQKAEKDRIDEPTKVHTKWDIVPLHSSLPNDEQAKAFRPQLAGHRKIILSTNIAESSVTVSDSCYVIDFCQTKIMTVDPITKYMSLRLEWASHVNCDQRAGRVGRTCDGRIYRLVSRQFYMDEMSKHSTPEILRAPLERIVLQAKMLDLNETPAQILALAMKPPNLKNIEATIWQLKEAGGLLKTCRGVLSNSDGDITFLGQVMAGLPVDVHLSKLIILGQLFSCLEETIIIAAGCSIQNIFSIPFQRRLEAYRKLLLWADGSCSDLIALLNLYTVWQNLKRENVFISNRNELEWCHKNLVSLKGLKEWHLLVTEIKQRLERLQIKETIGPGKVNLTDTERPTVLKVIMAGAFYPNLFIKSPEGNQLTEREAVKTVGGRDPFSTVYFTGMDPKQPGQVYVRPIKRMIRENTDELDVQIGFDGSTKVYIEFKNCLQRDPVSITVDGHHRLTSIPGRIPNHVYEMIRKRQLKFPFDLKILPPHKAWEFAEKHGVKRNPAASRVTYEDRNCFSTITYNPIPALDTHFIEINISNPIDAGHFWAQNADNETNEALQQLDEALNRQVLKQVDEPLKIGKIYAGRFKDDGLVYRCKVIAIGGRLNQVLFIDYGNIQEVTANDLFYLPQRPQCFAAPLAFECVMYGVKPAYKHNPLGMWDERINEEVRRLTTDILLFGEVYSVVNDVVELSLYRSVTKDMSLNQYLLNKGFAETCSPSFLSKQNHEQRVAVQSSNNPSVEAKRLSIDKITSYTDFIAPNIESGNYSTVQFRGPFSPLEIKLYCCTSTGATKSVDVEGTSVNAVLLDTEPESQHSRLLVAAHVGQTAEGNKLKLRQTTLMPSVPGFPMLLAAIFCPTMEPKLTSDNSLVAAILCGMGYNETTNKPFYPAHDILLSLDTELKIEELEKVRSGILHLTSVTKASHCAPHTFFGHSAIFSTLFAYTKINRLRYLMNNGLKLMLEMERNMSTQHELLQTQIKIKEHLFNLINMERNSIDRHNLTPQNTAWGKHGGLGLLKPSLENDEQDIWALLWFVKLANMSKYQREITKNLEDIENMIYNVIPFEQLTCMLCNVECYFLHDLRLHIISIQHKNEIVKFNNSLDSDSEDDD